MIPRICRHIHVLTLNVVGSMDIPTRMVVHQIVLVKHVDRMVVLEVVDLVQITTNA